MNNKEKCAKFYKDHPDYFLMYRRRPDVMEKNRIRRRTYGNSPERRLKLRARNAVRRAIKRGTLKRQPCVKCGAIKAEAHHPDYQKRWLIIWLCKPCHAKQP
jgi:hypothetical protein